MEKVLPRVAPLPSDAVTSKVNVPAMNGVPPISPVCGLIARPGGRFVADQVYWPDPPVAITRAEYCVPVMPEGRLVVVIASVLSTVKMAVLDRAPPGLITTTLTGP